MHTQTIPPDGERIVCDYLRRRVVGTPWERAFISNRLTARANGDEVMPDEDYAVIVRCDGSQMANPPVHRLRFGIRVIGPDTDHNGDRTGALGRNVAHWLRSAWALDSTHTIVHAPFVSGPARLPAATGERQTTYITTDLLMVSTTE